MSYLDWKVGDRVVCIKEDGWQIMSGLPIPVVHPQYGEICTIARLDMDGEMLFIAVQGRPIHSLYYAGHFRPVQPRAADISIFTAMLDPTKVPA